MIRYAIYLLSCSRLNLVYFNAKIKLIIDKKEGIVIKNKYEDIEIWSCNCVDELYDLTGEELFQLCEDEYISVYGKRELINKLFKMFVADDFDIKYVDYDMTDDCREDTIYLMNVYEDASVSVEVAHGNHGVKATDANTAFIFMDDCKQEIIDKCLDDDVDVILFDFESEENNEKECGDCCDYCDCKYDDSITTKSNSSTVIRNKDGKLNGFSSTWSDNTDDIFYSSSYSYYINIE